MMCQQGIYLYGENDFYLDMPKVEIECEFYTHICNDWYYYGTVGDARRNLYRQMDVLKKQVVEEFRLNELLDFLVGFLNKGVKNGTKEKN